MTQMVCLIAQQTTDLLFPQERVEIIFSFGESVLKPYLILPSLHIALSNTTFKAWSLYLKVNGTSKVYSHANYTGSYIRRTEIPGSVMLALSAADYVELFIALNTTDSAAGDVNYSSGYVHTGFGGFKLL